MSEYYIVDAKTGEYRGSVVIDPYHEYQEEEEDENNGT